MRLKTAKKIIIEAINKTVNRPDGTLPICPFLESAMGVGKTSLWRQIAKELNFYLITTSLASYEPTDIGGMQMPDGDSMKVLRPKWLLSDEERKAILDKGYVGIIYLFDELVQAPILNQNLFATISDEYRIGDYHIPLGDFVACCGNRVSDRSGVNQMPMHLRDRLTTMPIEANLDDWANYMSANKKDHRVVSWVRFQPEYLHKFERDATAFPTPRSLERVSDILSWNLEDDEMYSAIACQIGDTASASLVTHLNIHDKCPDLDEIVKTPDAIEVPTDIAIQYATISGLVNKVNNDNMGSIIKYVKKFDGEFVAFFIKDSVAKNRDLLQNKDLRVYLSTDEKIREIVL